MSAFRWIFPTSAVTIVLFSLLYKLFLTETGLATILFETIFPAGIAYLAWYTAWFDQMEHVFRRVRGVKDALPKALICCYLAWCGLSMLIFLYNMMDRNLCVEYRVHTAILIRRLLADAGQVPWAEATEYFGSNNSPRIFTMLLLGGGWDVLLLGIAVYAMLLLTGGVNVVYCNYPRRQWMVLGCVLLTVQTISYIVLCLGIDIGLPEILPLFGGYRSNFIYMMGIALILPSRTYI